MSEEPERRPRSGWEIAGIVLAWVVGVAGLAAVGFAIFFMVAINSWANNK